MSLMNAAFITALIAFGSVEAAKDKVRVSQWLATDCTGFPSANDFEMQLGQCKEVHAQSLKFHHPKKPQDVKWADAESQAKHTCYVTFFRDADCEKLLGYPKTEEPNSALPGIELPKGFEKCYGPPSQGLLDGIRSVKFHCENKKVGAPDPFKSTSTNTLVAYTHNRGQTASPHTYTSTKVFEYEAKNTTPAGHLEERVEATIAPVLGARDVANSKHHYKAHWYYHPWARSELCFDCWLTKEHNEDKFDCEASPDSDNTASGRCGAPPRDLLLQIETSDILTKTETHFQRVAAIATPAPSGGSTSKPAAHQLAERKTPKQIVRLKHPYSDVSTCAKAYWKHAGQGDKQKIVLKGPKKCDKDSDSWSINANPAETHTRTLYTTTTTTSTTEKTVAATFTTNALYEGMVGKDRILWERGL